MLCETSLLAKCFAEPINLPPQKRTGPVDYHQKCIRCDNWILIFKC